MLVKSNKQGRYSCVRLFYASQHGEKSGVRPVSNDSTCLPVGKETFIFLLNKNSKNLTPQVLYGNSGVKSQFYPWV
jgi:hypothetical protein